MKRSRQIAGSPGHPLIGLAILVEVGAVWLSLVAPLAAQSNGVVTGRVTDSRGSAENLPVRLVTDGEVPAGYAYTDSDGHYIFHELTSGTYYVVIEADGYRPVHERAFLDTQAQPKATVNISLEPLARQPSPASPVISGSPTSQELNAKHPTHAFSPNVLKEFDKGNQEQQNGNLEAALVHYRKAVTLDHDFYPALNNEGTLFERQKRHAEAAEAFSRVIELNPGDGEAYINLGHLLFEEGQYQAAVQQLEQGLKRSPNSATGNFFLGSTYFKLQDTAKAEPLLRRACELDPEHLPAAHLQLANLYLKRHESIAARIQLQTYLRQNPSDPQAPAIRRMLAELAKDSKQ
jgi:tetratricopeptide (TPR) repeat protein